MLKGIPRLLSPDLLKILMEMGHGDTIVIGDDGFPSASVAKGNQLVRMDGHGVCEVLDAILHFFPLDTYVDEPVQLMERVPGDEVDTPIWESIAEIVEKYEPGTKIGYVERFQFYKEAKSAYAVIATGETGRYACVILRKGVII